MGLEVTDCAILLKLFTFEQVLRRRGTSIIAAKED